MVDYDITPLLEARIVSQCPGFVTVDEAWFSEWVNDYSEETPAAYVYLAEDSAEKPNELSKRQSTAQVYGVYIICETGDTFRARRHEVRKALFGWQPIKGGAVMAFHSGQMQEISGRYIQWREYWTLQTPHALQATADQVGYTVGKHTVGETRPRTMTI